MKYSSLKTPTKTIDTDIQIQDLDASTLPSAPNFFHEVPTSPGRVEINFAPTHTDDQSFRLEFFDRYTEWDRYQLTGEKVQEDTPKTVVEMVTQDPTDVQSSEDLELSPVSRVIQ